MGRKANGVDSPEAMAHVLAMFMATQHETDPREVRLLEQLDAFKRIGMSKAEFLRIAGKDIKGKCRDFSEHTWLHVDDLELIDELLDRVQDTRKRLLLCRLASALITTDGKVEEFEHLVYDRMLLHWGYTRSSVAQAILAEHLG
jgi:hypothetical protein